MRILQLLRIGYVSFNGKILVNRDARLKKKKTNPRPPKKKPKAKKQKQTDNQSREKRYSSAQRVLIC